MSPLPSEMPRPLNESQSKPVFPFLGHTAATLPLAIPPFAPGMIRNNFLSIYNFVGFCVSCGLFP